MRKHKSYQEEYEAIKAFERLPENRIKVSEKLENPHPIVADTLTVLTHGGLKGLCSTPEHAPVVSLSVDAEIVDRALRVSDALFKALEKRGIKITTQKVVWDKKETINATFIVQGFEILYRVEEIWKRCPIPLEDREKLRLRIGALPNYQYRRTGLLRLQGIWGSHNNSILIERSKLRRIEDRLNTFVLGLYRQVYKILEDRRSQKIYARRREVKSCRRRYLREREAKKQQRIDDLLQMATDYQQAHQIRQFVQAAEDAGSADPHWIEWALGYADEIDPAISR
jgi:hypothetical protein